MRLVSARIQGLGRLVDTTIKLDQKLIAVVGPNESGKTTLLRALTHLDESRAIPAAERSRAASVQDGTATVRAHFVVEKDDQAALEDLELESPPQRMEASRLAEGGSVKLSITPRPSRSKKRLDGAVRDLARLLKRPKRAWRVTADSALQTEDEVPFSERVTTAVATLQGHLAGEAEATNESTATMLRDLIDDVPDCEVRDALVEASTTAADWLEADDPGQEVRDRLWNRTPDLVEFDGDARDLASTYVLDDTLIANIPPALANLARMADLDLMELHNAIQTGQLAVRESARARANSKLAKLFQKAWQQSDLTVELLVESNVLRIMLRENGVQVSPFDERSAGLRMFVALVAFLAAHDSGRPTVLLIDEAETHLHIDAQVDLVNMFMTQSQADKVIYTTHSPACLPIDLGVGIRALVPDGDQTSRVENSFWRNAGGFSPLMFAMGAAAAAFTPARCVVLAEGATEMILLPTLIRGATGLGALPYQVAPGLSEVPKDFYPKLDLEGSKVAYLLDGDSGGDDLENGLISAGVSPESIVRLEVPGIENVLAPAAYAEAVATLLGEFNPATTIPTLPDLLDPVAGSWAKQLDAWIDAQGLRRPSKVAVANWLLENQKATPSPERRKELQRLHRRLLKAVGGED